MKDQDKMPNVSSGQSGHCEQLPGLSRPEGAATWSETTLADRVIDRESI